MANESRSERDHDSERDGPSAASNWRSAFVVDLGGRILVTRRRPKRKIRERRDAEPEVAPRLSPAAE